MPIEFSCDACNRLLRVPDGSEGSQCECPACKTLLEIPSPNEPLLLEAAPLDTRLRIECPDCSHSLVCDPELEGTKGQCKNCKLVFLISRDPEAVKASISNQSKLVFTCPKCDQLFEGSKEMKGRKGKCHACGEVFAIQLKRQAKDETPAKSQSPSPSALPKRAEDASKNQEKAPQPRTLPTSKASTKSPATTKSSAAAAPAPSPRTAAEPENIQLSCYQCQGVMQVPGSAAGGRTACPYCQTELQIPGGSAASQPQQQPQQGLFDSLEQNQTSQSTGTTDIFSGVPSSTNEPSGGTGLWTDLGDMSGASDPYASSADSYADPYAANEDYSNPYAAPQASPSPSPTAYSGTTMGRSLTFSGAFSLFFERAFPNLILSSLIYFAISMAVGIGTWVGLFIIGIIVASLQLEGVAALVPFIIGAVLMLGLMLFIGAHVWSILCNGALTTMRGMKTATGELISTGNATGGILGYLLLAFLLHLGFSAIYQVIGIMLVNSLGTLGFLGVLLLTFLYFLAVLGLAFTPFAILDGQGTITAMNTSLSLYLQNFPTIVGIALCGGILLSAATIISIGFGVLLFVAAPFYMGAAIYVLAND